MAIKAEQPSPPKHNTAKWVVVCLILIAGVTANYSYQTVEWALRAAVGILVLLLALGIAWQTTQGQKAWLFAKSARSEIRKVTWPTRQEVTQTTLVVAVAVFLTALVLWGIDAFFLWGVAWLTGQQG